MLAPVLAVTKEEMPRLSPAAREDSFVEQGHLPSMQGPFRPDEQRRLMMSERRRHHPERAEPQRPDWPQRQRRQIAGNTVVRESRPPVLPRAAGGGPLKVSTRDPHPVGVETSADMNVAVLDGGTAQVQGMASGESDAGAPTWLEDDAFWTGVLEDEGEEDAEEDLRIDAALQVVQMVKYLDGESVQISFALFVEEDETLPNGLVLCQQVPEGWSVAEAVPAVSAFDEKNRIAKWLFMGDAVAAEPVYSVMRHSGEGQVTDWEPMRSWYSYKQPEDGTFVEVRTIHYAKEAF